MDGFEYMLECEVSTSLQRLTGLAYILSLRILWASKSSERLVLVNSLGSGIQWVLAAHEAPAR